MEHTTISSEQKALYKHLSFYLHEQRKWERALGRRLLWTIPCIALTLMAMYKQKPIETMAGIGVSAIGIKYSTRANFYLRRAQYRVRQQKRSI